MNVESNQSSELQLALNAFLNTTTLEEAYQVIQQHPILLTDQADLFLSSIISSARKQDHEETAMALDERRDFIRSVRQEQEELNEDHH
jgi:aromatic ring-opening dioxygenase LigB subunit